MMLFSLILSAVLLGLNSNNDDPTKISPNAAIETPIQQLQREYEAVLEAFSQLADQAASSDAKQEVSKRLKEQRRSFAERAFTLASDHPNEPLAVDALVWIVANVRWAKPEALRILACDHIKDDRIAEVCRVASGFRNSYTETLFRKAIARSPSRIARAYATYFLGERVEERVWLVRYFLDHPKESADLTADFSPDEWKRITSQGESEHRDEAVKLYGSVIENYPDVIYTDRFGRQTKLSDMARGSITRIRDLVVGQVVPDLEGEDVDGLRFKLSDYRGKVVVLTFSGNWCGPCVRDYPDERRLVEQWKNKPFALLSVNTDEDKTSLKKTIADGTITWRCWWDGGTSGPMTTRWGVSTFPTVYVIDSKGMIRGKQVGKEDLSKAVETLLTEVAP